MDRERGMFRVYRCSKCGHVDFVSVEKESETTRCSICLAIIVDSPGLLYTETAEEAKSCVKELFFLDQQSTEGHNSPRGEGIKKRVQRIVTLLVEMNRGRPVGLPEVIRECIDAGIDVERAMKFLEALQQEGRIRKEHERITVAEG